MTASKESEVLIFCTAINDADDLPVVDRVLQQFNGVISWSVDLEDWEKVLRVVCLETEPEEIVIALSNHGVFAREML